MLYIDREPLHPVTVPQMSKIMLFQDLPIDTKGHIAQSVIVKDMFLIYSEILMAKKGVSKQGDTASLGISVDRKLIEPIERVYKDLVDFCQDQVHRYALYTSYTSGDAKNKVASSLLGLLGFPIKRQETVGPSKTAVIETAKLAQEAELLRDYYTLLNTLLAFGAISLFKDYETLSLLAQMGVNSIKMNSLNPLLAHLLGVSQMVSDRDTRDVSKLNLKRVSRFFHMVKDSIVTIVKDKIATQFQLKDAQVMANPQKVGSHFGEGDEDEPEDDFMQTQGKLGSSYRWDT